PASPSAASTATRRPSPTGCAPADGTSAPPAAPPSSSSSPGPAPASAPTEPPHDDAHRHGRHPRRHRPDPRRRHAATPRRQPGRSRPPGRRRTPHPRLAHHPRPHPPPLSRGGPNPGDHMTTHTATERLAKAEGAIEALRSAAEEMRVGIAVGAVPLDVRPAVESWLCRLAEQRLDRSRREAAESTVSSAVVAPPTDQTALRDRIAEALMRWTERGNSPQYAAMRRPETVRANAYSRADAVLAVLYREGPWLRAEAEDAGTATDHTTPPAWVDRHPRLGGVAAAEWEQWGRSENGSCVDGVAGSMAVAALSAVRNTADDQAAENKRLGAKVFEWQGSYLDEVKVRQERDAEIARLRADRAAVLREAADRIDATRADFPIAVQNGITWATAEMRRHAADEQPGARHVHITIHHPDPTTANTAALCIADLVRGEYGDSHRLTITTDAPGTGAAPHRPADETPDTLAAWLYQRFMVQGVGWDDLDEGDRTYWEHHARAVRRAVARGGFKQPAAGARQDGAASGLPTPPSPSTPGPASPNRHTTAP